MNVPYGAVFLYGHVRFIEIAGVLFLWFYNEAPWPSTETVIYRCALLTVKNRSERSLPLECISSSEGHQISLINSLPAPLPRHTAESFTAHACMSKTLLSLRAFQLNVVGRHKLEPH